ncbi:translocation/assembly module TamB domain-containing protein [Microbulbifer guangxiensis]|uniref:translocation/assembly module TamB domain-containing protein n=1 Tax=Microbulbifer guangxiensis TaxID=2904249 RepID=UPI001EFF7D50|nr:translocation/assembly module TamB domain-containing protein [Microbulbifer guangxiensis]
MWQSLRSLISGYLRALGVFLRSLWQGISGRGSLLFSLFFVLLLAVLFLLGTEPGRIALTRMALMTAEEVVSGLEIETGTLSSPALGSWGFQRLRVDYEDGNLAQAENLSLAVDVQALLRGRIDIDHVRADSLRLDNDTLSELLEALGEEAEPPPVAEPFSLPSVRLGELSIGRLEVLDERLQGLPVLQVDATGSLQWPDVPAGLDLSARELNGSQLHLDLSASEGESGVIAVQLAVSEDARGFLGRLLMLPEDQALDAEARFNLAEADEGVWRVDIDTFSLPLVEHRFALAGEVELALSPWQVVTSGLALSVDETRHGLSGSVGEEGVDAELQLNRFPLSVSRPWQDVLQGGWLSADLTLRGPLSLPEVSGVIDLNSHFRQRPLRLQGRLETEEKVVTLHSATIDYADASLDASGQVDIGRETIDLEGLLEGLTVAELNELVSAFTDSAPLPPALYGDIEQLRVTAAGPWKNPRFTAELRAQPAYESFTASLNAVAEGDLKSVTISRLNLVGEGISIQGAGKVGIDTQSLDLKVQVAADQFRPAETLGIAATEGLVLNLDASAVVSGPWKKLRIASNLDSSGRYQQYRYRLEGAAAGNLDRVELDKMRLELFTDASTETEPLSLRGPQSLILRDNEPVKGGYPPDIVAGLAAESERLGRSGSAWLEVDGVIEPRKARADLAISGRNIPVSLAQLAGVELPPSLEGEVSLDGELHGPFARPVGTVNILAVGLFRGEAWHLQGNIGYSSGALQLSAVELVWADENQLSAAGSIDSKTLQLDLRGRGRLADLPLDLPADIRENGSVELWATASGSPEKPELAGEVRVDSQRAPAVRGGGQPLGLVLQWQTRADNLELSLGASHGDRQAVQAAAVLEVTPLLRQMTTPREEGEAAPPLPLNLQSNGSADLSVVAAFIDPDIHALKGQLNFALDASGSFADPSLDGRVELQGGSYEHRPTNTRLRKIDFLARFTPQRWVIERARAEDGESGSINLGGEVRFAGESTPELDFRLRAERAQLLNTPAVRGAVSGNLSLTGTTEASLLEGSLKLRPLTVQFEQLIGSSVPEIDVVEVEVDGPPVERSRPFLDSIQLAVQIVLDQQSYVRGLGLDSELVGTVDVEGTAAKPRAAGALRIVRGNFDLLGKRFELQEGQIQFENNVAAVFVKGRHQYADGEIIAEISGSGDDIDISFTSTPPAAQDEIFAQLLFGKQLADISPLQAVRLVSVVRTLQGGGAAAFDPVAKTRELLGVDTLDVQTEETDEGDQYALSLGKYITNRIYIELQRSTDPLNPWEAKMQIELRRSLNLQFKSADESESGAGSVELQWKRDY